MNTKKILDSEISDLKIASLPSRPTAPSAFGGRGYTAKDMKEAFDKLPLFIIEKFNTLLDDISSTGENSLASSLPTGLYDGHTLASLFEDITNGAFAEILSLGEESLSEYIINLEEKMKKTDDAISSLPKTVITDSCEIIMENAKIYRLGTLKELVISLPEELKNEYYSELSFDSGEDATVFSTLSKIRLSGDDVADEELLPKDNTHYTIFLWYDGDVQGVVRGLPNA